MLIFAKNFLDMSWISDFKSDDIRYRYLPTRLTTSPQMPRVLLVNELKFALCPWFTRLGGAAAARRRYHVR